MRVRKHLQNLLAALALTTMASSSWGAVLSLDPISQSGGVGTAFSVDLVISDLGDGVSPALAGYSGLQIAFDDSILEAVGATFTSRLGDIADPSAVVYSVNTFFPGLIVLDQVSLLDAATLFALQSTPSGSFVLATLTFNGIGNGTSSLTLSPGILSDETGNEILTTALNSSITVSGDEPVIPEPSTWMLLATGVGALAIYRRR